MKMEIFEYLGKYHGIDVVIPDGTSLEIVLLQNSAPLNFPTRLTDLLPAMRLMVLDENRDAIERAVSWARYTRVGEYLRIVESANPQPIPASVPSNLLDKLMKDYLRASHGEQLDIIRALPYLERQRPQYIHSFLRERIDDLAAHFGNRSYAIEAYSKLEMIPSEQIVKKMQALLADNRYEEAFKDCLKALTRFVKEKPSIFDFILSQADKAEYEFLILVSELESADPTFWQERSHIEKMIKTSRKLAGRVSVLNALAYTNPSSQLLLSEMKAFYKQIPDDELDKLETAMFLVRSGYQTEGMLKLASKSLFKSHSFGRQELALKLLREVRIAPDWLKAEVKRYADSDEEGIGEESQHSDAYGILQLWEFNEKKGI